MNIKLIVAVVVAIAIIATTLIIYTQKIHTTESQDKNTKIIQTILQQAEKIIPLKTAGSYIITTKDNKTYLIYNITRPNIHNYIQLVEAYSQYVYNRSKDEYYDISYRLVFPVIYGISRLEMFSNGSILNISRIGNKIKLKTDIKELTNKSAYVCFEFISNESYVIKYGVLVTILWKYFLPAAAHSLLLLNISSNKVYCVNITPHYEATQVAWNISTVVTDNDIERGAAKYVAAVAIVPYPRK